MDLFKTLLIMWIVIGICWAIVGSLWIIRIAHGQMEGLTIQEEEPIKNDNCILFSDGRFAVVEIYGYHCPTSIDAYTTVSWFLFKGYHIDTITGDIEGDSTSYGKAYMSR